MMTNGSAVHALLTSFVLAATAFGQSTPAQKSADPPCAPANQTSGKANARKPCTPAAGDANKPDTTKNADEATKPVETKKPSAAEQFPFPGEPAKSIAPANSAPDAPKPSTAHPSAADEHPFPGKPTPDTESSSSSSSSSSADPDRGTDPDAASSESGTDEAGSAGSRRKLPKVEKLQSDEERAAEDLSVAKFYEGNGNLNAAYLRTKDAVQVQPDDPETHFALAQIAQKLKKREEAIAEYNAYLKLDPDGEKIKAARKALSQLQ